MLDAFLYLFLPLVVRPYVEVCNPAVIRFAAQRWAFVALPVKLRKLPVYALPQSLVFITPLFLAIVLVINAAVI